MSIPRPKDLTQAPRAGAVAAFLLAEAAALGIKIGTDGTGLVMLAPGQLSRETVEWFYRRLSEHRTDVIAAIEEDVWALWVSP